MRFETPGPGSLLQHGSSEHQWVPGLGGYQFLILPKDEYSRLFVGAQLDETEGSFGHPEGARRAVERYGGAMACYVDQHSIFRFVEHHGVHVRYALGVDEGEIQFTRALCSLDTGLICARKGGSSGKREGRAGFASVREVQDKRCC